MNKILLNQKNSKKTHFALHFGLACLGILVACQSQAHRHGYTPRTDSNEYYGSQIPQNPPTFPNYQLPQNPQGYANPQGAPNYYGYPTPLQNVNLPFGITPWPQTPCHIGTWIDNQNGSGYGYGYEDRRYESGPVPVYKSSPDAPPTVGGVPSAPAPAPYAYDERARDAATAPSAGGTWKAEKPTARAAAKPSPSVAAEMSADYGSYAPQSAAPAYAPVTAGVTDDNANWNDYLRYINNYRQNDVCVRPVQERYLINVKDAGNIPAFDAAVDVYDGSYLVWSGRTDVGGRALFHPAAVWRDQRGSGQYTVQVRQKHSNGIMSSGQSNIVRQGNGYGVEVRLNYPQNNYGYNNNNNNNLNNNIGLDLVFVIDATGSMADEIDKLKRTVTQISAQINSLPERPNVRYGLVSYRDRREAYIIRKNDFTPSLNEFQHHLNQLSAQAGGDKPEDVASAIHATVHDLQWRKENTARLAILIGDAAPHLDYRDQPYSYDVDALHAAARGIKFFPIGASGLEPSGEYIFRQMAQLTGGKFVFLTYKDGKNPSSGAGYDTNLNVQNYSVETLDKLVVRLVRDELGQLGRRQ